MPKFYFVLALLLSGSALSTQAQDVAPTGGGSYAPPRAECLTPVQHQRIDSLVQANILRLQQQGVLPAATQQRPAAVPLAWPLRQATGFDYASYYGVSNFVDRNSTAGTTQIQDWNCSNRTYDGHNGLDIFLWPFDYNMMDAGQVDIVAAAPGVIVGKFDGNYDRNCVMSNANWNAVYVQNADGSICWYGHMKTGSLTSKPVGATVAQGEFLGKVGSSGSSTGPHLHFEVHGANGQIIDPYTGSCNSNATWWSTQKPYYESTLNTVMTHSAPPTLNTCPSSHAMNQTTAFMANDLVYFAAYYHDQLAGQTGTYTVYRPDNSVYATWTHSMTPAHYAASYWYWSYRLPTNAPSGTWRFAVAFQGNTVSRTFTVGTVSTTTQKAKQPSFSLYPNPAQQQFTVEAAGPLHSSRNVLIHNNLGQVVATFKLTGLKTTLPLTLAPGVYSVSLSGDKSLAAQRLVVY